MMREQGKERYFKTLQADLENGRGDKTSFGNVIIGENIAALSEEIEREMTIKTQGNRKVAQWVLMSGMTPKQLAMITLQIVTTKILEKTPFASLCVSIGKAIEDEQRMEAIREQDDRAYATLLKGNKFRVSQGNKRSATIRINRDLAAHEEWNEATRLRCGIVLFQCLQNALPDKFDIVVLADSSGRKHTTTKFVIPTQTTIDWMRKHVAMAQFLRPMYQPMVVPPIQWCNSRITGGGYVTNYINPLKLVKVRERKKLDVYGQTKMPAVFDAINAAQQTGWRVNNKVLDVILHGCEKNQTLGSMSRLSQARGLKL
jgi:DNA-directed RNA polymerase